MTTQQAIEALHALPRMGQGAPGLARMQNLCDHLGNPEKELQCIHIAGTNGKGSLAAMTSSILTAAGYKTGLTISPYVVDFRERFQIDGEMIPPRTLANLTEKVLDAIDAIEAEGGEKPVEFEAVTALAFLWFAREKCDLVVLETGLGGRCDATNVVPHKLVAAITKIGYDHMEVLGDTLDKIAAEKAGIIKEGAVVVNYPACGGYGADPDRRCRGAHEHHHARQGRFDAAARQAAGKPHRLRRLSRRTGPARHAPG